jgi:hypothetical protein
MNTNTSLLCVGYNDVAGTKDGRADVILAGIKRAAAVELRWSCWPNLTVNA